MESHEQDLRDEVRDEALVKQLQEDYTKASISAATRALLDYAVKLTLSPRDMRSTDVEQLRASGFTDAQIVDAVELIGYFNYINRVLDGLGAGPEPGMRFRPS